MARDPVALGDRHVAAERAARPTAAADVRAARPSVPLRALVRRLASVAALVVLDVSGVALGLYAALTVREAVRGQFPPLWGVLWEAETRWLPFLALITVLVLWQWGLYAEREKRAGIGRILPALALATVLAVVVAVGSGIRFNTFALAPTALVISALLITLFRASYESVTRNLLALAGVRRRVLLVGEPDRLAELRRTLGDARGGIEYEFVGAAGASPAGQESWSLGDVEEVPALLDRQAVDEVIVTDGIPERPLLELVEQAHARGVTVRVAPRTTQLLTHRAEYVPGQGTPLFELHPPALAGIDWLAKRAFDVVVSALALVVGLPLWLLIAAAIRLDSPGPVLYRDRRIGLGEREFSMLKFRTMHADAAERQPQLEEANEADGALFKLRDDPRVTRVGRVLRRFSLDEAPQVLNVLRGEMSLVGPRPLPLRDFEQLEPWHRKRYLVLPGMTGLWQIGGRSDLSFDDLVRLDFYYLDNWSIWLDISILLKTVPAVLARRGAY
ncbi:MAG: sugar transferase [Thermoleophilia bacterium]|nr:sugar transferase [Thermoleophilia bacterium]